jgi:hypothetical protein
MTPVKIAPKTDAIMVEIPPIRAVFVADFN